MEVVWTHSAQSSLASVAVYVARFFGREKADEVLRQIVAFSNNLRYAPRIGKRVDEWSVNGEEVRCAVFKQNQIYYTIAGDELSIVVIWDSRQNPSRLREIVFGFLNSRKAKGIWI